MRWQSKTKEMRRQEKETKLHSWHTWFAWRPVRLTRDPTTKVWLQKVWRKKYYIKYGGQSFPDFKYGLEVDAVADELHGGDDQLQPSVPSYTRPASPPPLPQRKPKPPQSIKSTGTGMI